MTRTFLFVTFHYYFEKYYFARHCRHTSYPENTHIMMFTTTEFTHFNIYDFECDGIPVHVHVHRTRHRRIPKKNKIIKIHWFKAIHTYSGLALTIKSVIKCWFWPPSEFFAIPWCTQIKCVFLLDLSPSLSLFRMLTLSLSCSLSIVHVYLRFFHSLTLTFLRNNFAVDCVDVMYCDAVADEECVIFMDENRPAHTHTHILRTETYSHPLNENRILEISIFEFRIDFCDWNEFIVLHASHHFEFPLECDPNTNQI